MSPQIITLKPTPRIPGLPTIASGANLITDNSIVKPAELVNGLLHQGTKGVLASSSKAGKTWVLLDLALSVATGTKFLRWHTTRGRVLFINLEIPTAFMKERLTALMRRRGLQDIGNLDFWNLRGKTADFEALVANIIKETEGKGYALIILDPIYKAMIGKSENTAGSVGALCHQIERLAERTGAAVLYAHHFAKGNSKKKTVLDRLSGSGAFSRDSDTIVALTEHNEPGCYTVETVLRNFPAQPSFVVEWDYPVMVEREDLDPEDVQIEEVDDEDDLGLLDIIKVKPLATWEWEAKALALGLSRSTFFRLKRKLKDNGYITFESKTKTWSLVKTDGAGTGDTVDTIDTPETVAGGTAMGETPAGAAGGVVAAGK